MNELRLTGNTAEDAQSHARAFSELCRQALGEVGRSGPIKERLRGFEALVPYLFVCSNLTGADLSGEDLTGFDFTGANLTGANLAGARIEGCCFDQARVSIAQLASAADWADFVAGWRAPAPRAREAVARPGDTVFIDPLLPEFRVLPCPSDGTDLTHLSPAQVRAWSAGQLAMAIRPISAWQLSALTAPPTAASAWGRDRKPALLRMSDLRHTLRTISARTAMSVTAPSPCLLPVMAAEGFAPVPQPEFLRVIDQGQDSVMVSLSASQVAMGLSPVPGVPDRRVGTDRALLRPVAILTESTP